jgi:NAD(P)-dependent dehydrogenase (short-subunit alcohol dehydrogenase family)
MARYLVIAGSSTIGQKVTELLREQQHTVFTTARDNSKINPDFILDATQFSAVDDIFANIGPLNGVVNCSGSLLLRSAHMTSEEQYLDTLNASLTTSFAVVRAAGKHMKQGGSVVLISSAAAQVGLANHEAIAAAKAGVEGLARSAAATYATQQLRFNVVAPGLVETHLSQALTSNELARKASEMMHPLGRIGQAEDIARAIVFLLDEKNTWISGAVLPVDGGLAHLRSKVKA